MATRTSARPRGVAALATAGAVAFVVVLAGCSDAGEGEGSATTGATSPVTVSATSDAPTPTPSATEASAMPPLPDAARENTPEGAEAFIRYYFDVVNLLHQAPPSVVEIDSLIDTDLVDPECQSCEVLRGELREFAEGGFRTLGPIYSVDSMTAVGGGLPGVQRFNMSMRIETHVIEKPATGERYEREERNVEGVGAAIWEGEKWLIYDMELA